MKINLALLIIANISHIGSIDGLRKKQKIRNEFENGEPPKVRGKINDCESSKIPFGDSWQIKVNGHCSSARKFYEVSASGTNDVNGVYENYGVLNEADKFIKTLPNGTTFSISRLKIKSDKFIWAISRPDMSLLYVSKDGTRPPKADWRPVEASSPAPTVIKIRSKKKIQKKLSFQADRNSSRVESVTVDSLGNTRRQSLTADEKTLSSMLHPAVGKSLGQFLNPIYISADPVNSISIDGLIDYNLLQKSLTYEDIPLSKWVGPEEGLPCCKGKYRLNFDAWRTNKYAKGLQALISHPSFIGFLEGLTGIQGLVPVRYSDPQFIQLGSSMIAISRGGLLHVHNDVGSTVAQSYIYVYLSHSKPMMHIIYSLLLPFIYLFYTILEFSIISISISSL